MANGGTEIRYAASGVTGTATDLGVGDLASSTRLRVRVSDTALDIHPARHFTWADPRLMDETIALTDIIAVDHVTFTGQDRPPMVRLRYRAGAFERLYWLQLIDPHVFAAAVGKPLGEAEQVLQPVKPPPLWQLLLAWFSYVFIGLIQLRNWPPETKGEYVMYASCGLAIALWLALLARYLWKRWKPAAAN